MINESATATALIRERTHRSCTEEYVQEAENLLKNYDQEPTDYNAIQWAKWMVGVYFEGYTFDPRVKSNFANIVHLMEPFNGHLKNALWAVLTSGHFHETNSFAMPSTRNVLDALKKDVWRRTINVEMDADWRRSEDDDEDNDIQSYYWDDIVNIAQ